MTTLAESPSPKTRLVDIDPNEVSIVDMPANGEPLIVTKRMDSDESIIVNSEQSSQIKEKKMDKFGRDTISSNDMKSIIKRIENSIESINELNYLLKRVKCEENNNARMPRAVVDMVKSISSDIRNIRSDVKDTNILVEKRSMIDSVAVMVDRIEDIKKAEAVSYLTRDQYVSVVTSVSEYLTTYVQGVEHDDDGPLLIPSNIDSVVDDSTTALEKLVADVEPQETPIAKELHETIKSDITNIEIEKKGSKMAAERFSRLKTISGQFTDAVSELSNIVKELEGEEMDETVEVVEETVEVTKSVDVDAGIAQGTILKTIEPDTKVVDAIKAFDEKITARFDEIMKQITDISKVATEANEKVEKVLKSRGDSRSADVDATTVVAKRNDSASFASILGIE